MNDTIFHITFRHAWDAAQSSGIYAAVSLSEVGFIHCSQKGQVMRVANSFYAGEHGLVLLAIDPAHLTSELRWEPGTDLPTELFPHIYGPLNVDAVVSVLSLEPGMDGKFQLPESLDTVDS